MLVPRFYRGRLVGFVQREDHGRALRTLKELDRAADRAKHARVDPAIYDQALQALGGAAGAETDKADRMEVRTR